MFLSQSLVSRPSVSRPLIARSGTSLFTGLLSAAFLLGSSLGSSAQTLPTAAPPSAMPATAAVAATHQLPPAPGMLRPPVNQNMVFLPGSGEQEGIKVHGHWIIDVKNPDGTLAQHRDFENALQYDGVQYLVGLLSGNAVSSGQYEIYFTSPSGGTSPCTTGTYPFCAIVSSTTVQPGLFACQVYYCVGGLTTTATFGSSASFKLAGNMTAPGAGTIGNVYVGHSGCGNETASLGTTTAAACSTNTTAQPYSGTMTGTTITSVPVIAGQIIQITVTISFS